LADYAQVAFTTDARDKFNLVNRGFHWINEYPFQR
jgi:hypothetical protein